MRNHHDGGGQVFLATISSSALSTGGGHDILTLTSTIATRVEILAVELQQLTTTPTPVLVELLRGSTGTPAGASLTPTNAKGWAQAPAAKSALTANSSTPLSTASAVRLHAGGIDADGTFCYRPDCPPVIDHAQKFHIRVGTPGIAAPIAATLTFREGGKIP